jgi:hypothetical protein
MEVKRAMAKTFFILKVGSGRSLLQKGLDVILCYSGVSMDVELQ